MKELLCDDTSALAAASSSHSTTDNDSDHSNSDNSSDESISTDSVIDDSLVRSDSDDNDNEENDYGEFDEGGFASKCKWVSRFALFGDSSAAVVLSFLMLVMALCISYYLEFETQTAPNLGPIPKMHPAVIYSVPLHNDNVQDGYEPTTVPPQSFVTTDMRDAYVRDGVIAVRGLIDVQLLDRLDKESQVIIQDQLDKKKSKSRPGAAGGSGYGTQFFTVDHSTIFKLPESKNQIENEDLVTEKRTNAFLNVSLFSKIPQMAAELLQAELSINDDSYSGICTPATTHSNHADCSNSNFSSLRLLRDIFLAKDEDQYICGWHVDDSGFWPATASSPGINAWVALDDMPIQSGGGFALAIGSHTVPWKDEAHRVTGATTTQPETGFKNAKDMFSNRSGDGTCNLKTSAPHLHQRMEDTKRVYDIQRGDVIFHTRWLFHRTISFDKETINKQSSKIEEGDSSSSLIYRRYSIRYGPGSSIVPPGYGVELSVLWDPKNGGQSADEICNSDGPWYPRAWPSFNQTELNQLDDLISNKLPVAENRREERKAEMRSILKSKKPMH